MDYLHLADLKKGILRHEGGCAMMQEENPGEVAEYEEFDKCSGRGTETGPDPPC